MAGRRAGYLRTTGVSPLVTPVSPCHPVPMADPLHPVTLDEALGFRAFVALLDGDIHGAACALAAVPCGSRVAFLCLLAVVLPSVALRLAPEACLW